MKLTPLPVHVVVLAKAPVAGQAKTRLAPVLGLQGAANWAQRLLHDTLARVQAACSAGAHPAHRAPPTTALTAELCASPPPCHADWAGRLPPGVWAGGDAAQCVGPPTAQGHGDLGQRMARASQRVTATGHAVLLVGTDCPTLTPALLRQAAHQLQHHHAVLLPASDGGYVLLGLRAHCAAVFEAMPWSTDQVARLTLARLRAQGLHVWVGPVLNDVDEAADLAHLPPGWAGG